MSQIKEKISKLVIFNEKARKLADSGFIKSLTDSQTGLMVYYDSTTGNSFQPSIGRIGASNEELDAFVLTYRFFIQDNDAISFRKIAEIYEDPRIKQVYRDCFKAARDELNNFLSSKIKLGLIFDNEKPTNGKIIDIFIYGELAHTNFEKRNTFQEWTKDETIANLLRANLYFSLVRILNIILYVLVLNEGVIEDLSS